MLRQSPPYAEGYNASLDWLTLSAPTAPGRNVMFQRAAVDLMETLKSEGAKEERFGIQGYAGEKYEGVALGVRESDGHTVLAVHGARTNSIADWAIREGIDFVCRRLDPAMTIQFRRPIPYYGEFLRRRMRQHEKAQGREQRTVFTLFEKAKQDTGAYLGSRSSATMLRIYDEALYHTKKTDFTIWKHEMETKGMAAIHAWGQYKVADDKAKLCAEWVTTGLNKHGVCPQGIEKLAHNPLVGTKPRSEFDVWLAWARRSCFPRMKAEMVDGNAKEIRAALIAAGILRPDGTFAMPVEQQQELEFDDENY